MPQFVPPPLMDDAEAPAPLSPQAERYALYQREPLRAMADMNRVRMRAREGAIPDDLRPTYWMLMLDYVPLKSDDRDASRRASLAGYNVLVKEVLHDFKDFGLPLQDDPKRIDIDIPRTLPTLHFFASHETMPGTPTTEQEAAAAAAGPKGCGPGFGDASPFTKNQQALRRILHLFARVNAGAGYVQGMNELVGHMLYAFAGGKGHATPQMEADVFFSFQKLHQFVGDNFQREMDLDANGIKGTLAAFDALLKVVDPQVHAYLGTIALVPEFYAFRWITLMFSQDFFTPDVLSLWDFLLSFGDVLDAAVLFTAVAMVTLVRDRLMGEGFGTCIQLLQSYPHDQVDLQVLKRTAITLFQTHGAEKARNGRTASRSATPESQRDSADGATDSNTSFTGARAALQSTATSIGRAATMASTGLKHWFTSMRKSNRGDHAGSSDGGGAKD